MNTKTNKLELAAPGEDQEQIDIVDWLQRKKIQVWMIPNGMYIPK